MRYLKRTASYGLSYYPTDLEINGFVDDDFPGDRKDRKPMTRYIIKLGTAPCISVLKKQAVVALSICEAVYRAMVSAVRELIWIKRVIKKADWRLDMRRSCGPIPSLPFTGLLVR